MKTAVKILRALLLTVVFIIIGIPAIGYVMLSTDWAQARIKNAAEEGLSSLLGTKVGVGNLDFSPFNRLMLDDVEVYDDYNEKALTIKAVDARIELADLIFRQKFIIDYISVKNLDAKIYKKSADEPLSIQDIIAKFKSEEKKEPSKMRLRLNNVDISQSRISYDVLDAAYTPEKFNPNHILLEDFNATLFAPTISSDKYNVNLEHLSFIESSGFEIKELNFKALLCNEKVELDDFLLMLPDSKLKLGPIEANVRNLNNLANIGVNIPVTVEIEEGSHLYLPDFKAFVPQLGTLDENLYLTTIVSGQLNNINFTQFNLSDQNGILKMELSGNITDLQDKEKTKINGLEFDLYVKSNLIRNFFNAFAVNTSKDINRILSNSNSIDISGIYQGGFNRGDFNVSLASGLGDVDIAGDFSYINKSLTFNANAQVTDAELGLIVDNADLGSMSGELTVNGKAISKKMRGDAVFDIQHLHYKGYKYQNLSGNISSSDSLLRLDIDLADQNAELKLTAHASQIGHNCYAGEINANVANIRLDELNIIDKYPGYAISADINGHAQGCSISDFEGLLQLKDIRMLNDYNEGLTFDKFMIDADCMGAFDYVNVYSDILNGSIEGHFDLATIGALANSIAIDVFPSLLKNKESEKQDLADNNNEFVYDLTISNAEEASKFFKLPVNIIDPINFTGEISAKRKFASISVDAPWLLQSNKLIDNTFLAAYIDGANKNAKVLITSHMPTKKGPMDILATVDGVDGKLFANFDWQLERLVPINGNFNFITEIGYDYDENFLTTVKFNPGEINFGNDVWKIKPSTITYANKSLDVDNFLMETPTQSISINGKASEAPLDVLTVNLNKIKLLDIFETLDIDKALICGEATGCIFASQIFTKEPQIHCENLHVVNIGYNNCVFGDADVKVDYDNEEAAFKFDADVVNNEGLMSHINGKIIPATEGLDFLFDANRLRAAFLKPFMSAFCSDIDGILTGKARMYGTFKYIDLEGEVEAEDLMMRIDFTNTEYYANTKVKIDPGLINLKDITLRDKYGHTALLNGFVKHDFFKSPVFNFNITDAHDFLSYDVPEEDNSRWYGRIFGNGSVFVNGKPGVVNIGANMSTAPNSTFTFQLLDSEDAEEYSFISFRDVTPHVVTDSIIGIVIESEAEKRIRELSSDDDQSDPTAYNIDLNIDINTNAWINLVMDPKAGDMIKAQGNGQMQLAYHSIDNDIWMLGTYTLEKGTYNFSFQNIILKDFKIKEGSSITFTGDPYQGILNISAYYATNANLSDLDESFLSDKDLNRTNVQVHAIMNVTGNMMQPDIKFDLEFPKLNQDVYRKVRSIVSTEEMMNRQIVYLLALNRFYTPEYMASTTKGSELFSVASSTISSQLSSMLGKLSENWSIAPNLRSDRGDFSDVEVDVNLSSSLLNNRLLFNGNFGYRDKSLNTNQFIGDFDIEYLLNRRGSLRLKAYNRYNDQNYYLRTAQTTQGVGLMYRMDFDNLFGFLKKSKAQPVDTLVITPDSIAPVKSF